MVQSRILTILVVVFITLARSTLVEPTAATIPSSSEVEVTDNGGFKSILPAIGNTSSAFVGSKQGQILNLRKAWTEDATLASLEGLKGGQTVLGSVDISETSSLLLLEDSTFVFWSNTSVIQVFQIKDADGHITQFGSIFNGINSGTQILAISQWTIYVLLLTNQAGKTLWILSKMVEVPALGQEAHSISVITAVGNKFYSAVATHPSTMTGIVFDLDPDLTTVTQYMSLQQVPSTFSTSFVTESGLVIFMQTHPSEISGVFSYNSETPEDAQLYSMGFPSPAVMNVVEVAENLLLFTSGNTGQLLDLKTTPAEMPTTLLKYGNFQFPQISQSLMSASGEIQLVALLPGSGEIAKIPLSANLKLESSAESVTVAVASESSVSSLGIGTFAQQNVKTTLQQGEKLSPVPGNFLKVSGVPATFAKASFPLLNINTYSPLIYWEAKDALKFTLQLEKGKYANYSFDQLDVRSLTPSVQLKISPEGVVNLVFDIPLSAEQTKLVTLTVKVITFVKDHPSNLVEEEFYFVKASNTPSTKPVIRKLGFDGYRIQIQEIFARGGNVVVKMLSQKNEAPFSVVLHISPDLAQIVSAVQNGFLGLHGGLSFFYDDIPFKFAYTDEGVPEKELLFTGFNWATFVSPTITGLSSVKSTLLVFTTQNIGTYGLQGQTGKTQSLTLEGKLVTDLKVESTLIFNELVYVLATSGQDLLLFSLSSSLENPLFLRLSLPPGYQNVLQSVTETSAKIFVALAKAVKFLEVDLLTKEVSGIDMTMDNSKSPRFHPFINEKINNTGAFFENDVIIADDLSKSVNRRTLSSIKGYKCSFSGATTISEVIYFGITCAKPGSTGMDYVSYLSSSALESLKEWQSNENYLFSMTNASAQSVIAVSGTASNILKAAKWHEETPITSNPTTFTFKFASADYTLGSNLAGFKAPQNPPTQSVELEISQSRSLEFQFGVLSSAECSVESSTLPSWMTMTRGNPSNINDVSLRLAPQHIDYTTDQKIVTKLTCFDYWDAEATAIVTVPYIDTVIKTHVSGGKIALIFLFIFLGLGLGVGTIIFIQRRYLTKKTNQPKNSSRPSVEYAEPSIND